VLPLSSLSPSHRSARLHTSVLVRQSTLEHNISWPSGLRLHTRGSAGGGERAAKGHRQHPGHAHAPAPTVHSAEAHSQASDSTGDGVSAPAAHSSGDAPAATGGHAGIPAPHPTSLVRDSSLGSVSSATSAGSDSSLNPDDPLLTWSWDVFELPLTALTNVPTDDVVEQQLEADAAASAAAAGSHALGAAGFTPFHLAQTPKGRGSAAIMFAAPQEHAGRGETRLAEAVLCMFRQFALLR
jgi:hypothetical protein